jgi:hypothetical protein
MSETHIEPPAPPPGGPPPAPPVEPPAPPPEPPAAEVSWPEDWRDRFVKKAPATEREALAKRLNRFSSPDNLLSSYLGLDKQLRSGELKRSLSADATPEEVTEYRKSHGIPDEPTVEAYGLKFPDGYEPNDADKADVGEFLAEMHKINAPPAFVQAAWNRYLGTQAKVQQQLRDAAQALTEERRVEIRTEYGKDYKLNTTLGDRFLAKHAGGQDKAQELADTMLWDGTRLGDLPLYVRTYVNAALSTELDDDAMERGDGSSGGLSLEESLKAAIDLEYTDFEKWRSPDHQAKLQKLNAAKQRKKAA